MPYDDRMFELLRALDEQELSQIWTEALKRKASDEDFERSPHAVKVDRISREWRSVHGHTLANLLRDGHELPWRRILIDVADKLKPGAGWSVYRMEDPFPDEEIEQTILRYVDAQVRRAWKKLNNKKRNELLQDLQKQAEQDEQFIKDGTTRADLRHVTVTALGAGIGQGLLTGGGLLALAQGSALATVGGLAGGVLSQLGLWLVFNVLGTWSAMQLLVGGGAATVGGLVVIVPAAFVLVANAVMASAYRKTIPATLMLLMAHEMRRQLSEMKAAA